MKREGISKFIFEERTYNLKFEYLKRLKKGPHHDSNIEFDTVLLNIIVTICNFGM